MFFKTVMSINWLVVKLSKCGRLNSTQMLTEFDYWNRICSCSCSALVLWGQSSSTFIPDLCITTIVPLLANCTYRNQLNELMNNVLLSPRCILYKRNTSLDRVLITQMWGSRRDVNKTWLPLAELPVWIVRVGGFLGEVNVNKVCVNLGYDNK